MFWFVPFLPFWSSYIQFVFLYSQAPPAYLHINVMASLRKKLSMALGLNSEVSSSASKTSSRHRRKTSIDSGYHSMIAKPECGNSDSDSQAATFVTSGTEGSPDQSPKKLRKTISSTFSGAMQAFSNTVRATTSYIYPTTGESELPSSEWLECATPKKGSPQSSVMSSFRSRKQRFTPRASGTRIESPETQTSPVPVTQDESPALDVKIPNPSLSYEHLGKCYVSNGSQLLTGVKLPPGSKNLWPGPTRLRIPPDPYDKQNFRPQDDLSIASSSNFDLDHTPPESNKRYMSDDKGYLSEVESNAEIFVDEGLSPACLKYVALGSPEAGISLPSHDKKPAASHNHGTSSGSPHEKTILSMPSTPLEPEPSKRENLDGTAEQTASLEPPNTRLSRQTSSLEDGLNALFPEYPPAVSWKSKSLSQQLPSDVYDTDVKNSESSMGSRAVWECIRADRDRRYEQIFHTAPDTESDKESSPELELKRSPSRKPVHYAEEPFQSKAGIESSEPAPGYPASDLRYAVEAIERQAFPIEDASCAVEAAEKPALPTGDLAYAVEAIDRPSVTTFEPLETVYQQRPMLRLSDTVDERRKSPQALEPTVTTRRLNDEEHVTFGAENVEGKSIHQRSPDPSAISANTSPKNQSHTAPENGFEEGIEAGSPFVPASVSRSSPVGDDACLAGLRAAGTSEPVCSPDGVHTDPVGFWDSLEPFDCGHYKHLVKDSYDEVKIHAVRHSPPIPKETSRTTYREELEAGSPLPKQELPEGTHFQHCRTVSGWTNNTDNSGVTTLDCPSSKAPPPFPNLLVQSEPARCILNAFDAITIYGHDKIRISRPANAGIIPSLPSPFDYHDKQTNEAGLKSFSPIASEGANSPERCAQMTSLEQYDLQGPSPGSASSMQTRSNSNTPQRLFNAAKLPSFGSPFPMASNKARRKQRKSSNRKTNSSSRASDPDFSLPKLESNKNSAASGRMPMSRCGSPRLAQGSAGKPSPNHSTGKKYKSSRHRASAEEPVDLVGDLVRWSHSTSKCTSSNKNLYGERDDPGTLTPSPSRIKLPRSAGAMSFEEFRDDAERAITTPESRHQPKFPSINYSNSINKSLSLQASGGLDGTSYARHELDNVIQGKSPDHSYQHPTHDLQQEGNGNAEYCVGGNETIGRDREPHKDALRNPHPKKSSNPPPEAAKMSSVQRELEKRSDRPCSRLAGKLKNGALADVHAHELNSTHRDGRPPWRP